MSDDTNSCPSLGACPFFNDKLEAMPSVADMLKEKYCRGTYETCARYMVSQAQGKERVPADLFPNQRAKATTLLGK